MSTKIKGVTVTLYSETQSGTDRFNQPIYTETAISVDNVLIGEPTTDEILSSTQIYGKKLAYTLAIPKEDTNDWVNKKIEINGELFQSYGYPTQGIEDNIPLDWNKKVKVEKYG